MDYEEMSNLVDRLAQAKSRRDVAAALSVLHDQMRLETPAIGHVAIGPAENEAALTRFFTTFPDYEVEVTTRWFNEQSMVCRGVARMTMTGSRWGVEPNGYRVALPVLIEFSFKDGMIASERFSYDLSNLCAQSGVSTDVVRRAIFGTAWQGDVHAAYSSHEEL